MMPAKGECSKCHRKGKISWANYAPYCDNCLHEKCKNMIPYEEAVFPENNLKKEIIKIKKRLDKLEKKLPTKK